MACDVDELDINPFFKLLQTKFLDLYNRAQEKCFMICIPQATSIEVSAINKDFAETHILRPSPYFKGELLTNHGNSSYKTVTLDEDGRTLSTGEGFPSDRRVRIVSEELAYNKDYKQYRILILEQPLDPKFLCEATENGHCSGGKQAAQCVTLTECKQFLHSVPEFSKVLDKVDQSLKMFNTNYMVLPKYLMDAASRLANISREGVESCIQSVGRKKAADLQWRDCLFTAMESYVMSRAQRKVMGVISQRCAADDTCVYGKCQQQLKGISGEALGIQRGFVCPMPDAVKELNRLDQLTTPREKLHCLKSVIDAVTNSIAAHLSRDVPPHLALTADKPCLTSDDLIPILVNVMGQSECRHLQSDLVYMETFSWASSAKDRDDLSFCLVTFKAAVQYILDTDFSHLPHKNACRKQTSMDRLSAAAERLSVSSGNSRGDKSPSPCHSPSPRHSPTTFPPLTCVSTMSGGDRQERQRSRLHRVLDETVRKEGADTHGEHRVQSIFGVQYNVPVTLDTTSRSQEAPQLGDFLSSLQDDFMDQPFGKLS